MKKLLLILISFILLFCITSVNAQTYAVIGTDSTYTVGSDGASMFQTYYHDGIYQLTFSYVELNAAGIYAGDTLNSASFAVATPNGQAMLGANISITLDTITTSVWSGVHSASAGWNDFSFTTPVVYTGGDLVLQWCFDNTSFWSSSGMYYSATTANSVEYRRADSQTGCSMVPNTSTDKRANTRFSYTPGVAVLGGGCTDSTACNYNPLANIDDGSCILSNCVTNITQNTFSTTIQAAIDSSINGDTIIVSPGTYVENINFNGKNIVLASEFLFNNDTSYISSTIIDGNQNRIII